MKRLLFIFVFIAAKVWAEDIKDVKPPVAFPVNLVPWIVMGAIALVIAVVFFFKKRPKPVVPAKIQSPWEKAYERLEHLQSEMLIEKKNWSEYFFKLSLIVRMYIEDKYQINAPEMTTEEFLKFMEQSNDLNSYHKDILKGFLVSCDLVKFAKYQPQADETEKSFALAKKLIDETKPQVNEVIKT
jgi:hypothetical protein